MKKPRCSVGNKPCGLVCIPEKQTCHRDMLEPQVNKVEKYRRGEVDEADLSSALVNDPGIGTKLPKETALAVARSRELSDLTKKRYFASASREWNIPHSMGSNPEVNLKEDDPEFRVALHARGIKHYGEEIPEDKEAQKETFKEFLASNKWKLASIAILAATGAVVAGSVMSQNSGGNKSRTELAPVSTINKDNQAAREAAQIMGEAGVITSQQARDFYDGASTTPGKISVKEDYAMLADRAKKLYNREGPEYYSGRDRDEFEEIFGYTPEDRDTVDDYYGTGTLRHLREDAITAVGSAEALDSYVAKRRTGVSKPPVDQGVLDLVSNEEKYIMGAEVSMDDLREDYKSRLKELSPDRRKYRFGDLDKKGEIISKYDTQWEKQFIAGGEPDPEIYLRELDRRRVLYDSEDLSSEFVRPMGGNKLGSFVPSEDRQYVREDLDRIDAYNDPSSWDENVEARKLDPNIPDDSYARAEAELRTYAPIIDSSGEVVGSSEDAMNEDIGAGRDDSVNIKVKSEGDRRLAQSQAEEQKQLWKILPERLYTPSLHKSLHGDALPFEDGRAAWISERASSPEEAEFVSDMLSQGVSKYGLVLEEMRRDYGGVNPREVLGSEDYKKVFKLYKKQLEKKVKLGEGVLPFFAAVETPGEIKLKDGQEVETYQYPSSIGDMYNYGEITQTAARALVRAVSSPVKKIHKINFNREKNNISGIVTTHEGNTLYVYISPEEVFIS